MNYEMNHDRINNYPPQAQDLDDTMIPDKGASLRTSVHGVRQARVHSDNNRSSVTVARILHPHQEPVLCNTRGSMGDLGGLRDRGFYI
jgi:hypothetical protein